MSLFSDTMDQDQLDGMPTVTVTAASPEAPYGYNPDTGKPYTMSPEERERRGQMLAAARAKARESRGDTPKTKGAPPRKASAATLPPEVEYAKTVAGVLQLPAFALGLVGRFTSNKALEYDALATSLHTPGIAQAVGEMALDNDRLAALLERIAEAGPYATLITAAMPLLFQVMVNHRMLQASPETGTIPVEDMEAMLKGGSDAAANPS